MKYDEQYYLGDMDEQQHLSTSSMERKLSFLSNKNKKKKAQSSISAHFLNNSTAYCIVLTILIVCFAVLEIQRMNQKIPQLKQTQEHVSRQKLFEVAKPEKGTVEVPPQLMPNKFKTVQQKQKSKEEEKKEQSPAPKKQQKEQEKQKQKKETKKGPINKRSIAKITPTQRQKAGIWAKIRNQNIYSSSPVANEERSYYQQKYNISKYDQLPFCIVVPSYNNVEKNRHINNIISILMQEYKNYHIVFIDDASTDGTGEQVEQFLVANQTKIPSESFIVVKNKEQKRAMPNLRIAAKKYCKPEEIFLIVDGDDELLGRQVLKLFNSVFQQQKVWFVYTNFLTIKGGVGYSRPFPQRTIKANSYRKYPFVTSHLRAFYTQLFLNIKEEDLKDKEGNYLKAANDVAICLPILEMSHEKIKYVPELTYVYNSNTGQNNHRLRLKEQKSNNKMLRFKPKYQPLAELFPEKAPKVYQQHKNGKI